MLVVFFPFTFVFLVHASSSLEASCFYPRDGHAHSFTFPSYDRLSSPTNSLGDNYCKMYLMPVYILIFKLTSCDHSRLFFCGYSV